MHKLFIKSFVLVLTLCFVTACQAYRNNFGGAKENEHLSANEGEELSMPKEVKKKPKCGCQRKNKIPDIPEESEEETKKIITDEPPGFY